MCPWITLLANRFDPNKNRQIIIKNNMKLHPVFFRGRDGAPGLLIRKKMEGNGSWDERTPEDTKAH